MRYMNILLKRPASYLDDDIVHLRAQEIRGTAKDLTDKRQQNYIDGRLGLIRWYRKSSRINTKTC